MRWRTTWGHSGQTALDRCMADFGGFEHNLQSLRIVDLLEDQYPNFDGLNLTWETREGILKHCSRENALRLGALGERFLKGEQPSLEAQLVNIADAIAYSTHDIDDGLRVGYLDEKDLIENVPLYAEYHAQVDAEYPDIQERRKQKEVVRRLIGYMVDDLVSTSRANIEAAQPKSPLISFSEEARGQMKILKSTLMDKLYRHYRVLRAVEKSADMITQLYQTFARSPALLPPLYQERSKRYGVERTVADYIAGMTDRYAVLEFNRVLNPAFEI